MQTLLVANPKGGSGKTTLATNIAGWLASAQAAGSCSPTSIRCARRPNGSRGGRRSFRAIAGWTPDSSRDEIKERNPHWLVIDTPAGLHGESLRDAMHRADILLVPVSPSAFDMARHPALSRSDRRVQGGQEGRHRHRTRRDARRPRTNSAVELEEFLKAFEFDARRAPARRRRSTSTARATG